MYLLIKIVISLVDDTQVQWITLNKGGVEIYKIKGVTCRVYILKKFKNHNSTRHTSLASIFLSG